MPKQTIEPITVNLEVRRGNYVITRYTATIASKTRHDLAYEIAETAFNSIDKLFADAPVLRDVPATQNPLHKGPRP